MKSITYKHISDLASDLSLPPDRGMIAEVKAKLTKEIIKTIDKKGLTHKEISALSGISSSTITSLVKGSLQKVSLEQLIHILASLGKVIDFKVKTAI